MKSPTPDKNNNTPTTTPVRSDNGVLLALSKINDSKKTPQPHKDHRVFKNSDGEVEKRQHHHPVRPTT
ncbi:hypothetical protein [Corynebacterium glutamicum]|uniref:hypothetical protein n=1 Tax=Corynebacterium glutamicum TaxID=1718 RepID=UPI0011AA2BA3|nr:hypothetical protein [Corynebacterium glutamicum]